ncbi:MAG: hypothetical protein IVW54_16845 [Candidatus Binataceae bacterium]|nr:hypothetical protein [Candidatus Binataceae bacterium]
MIDLRFRPLKAWPKEQRPLAMLRDAFKTGWPATLEKLEHELKKQGAANIEIAAGFGMGDIRNDGWPMTGRKPGHPGVILSFTTDQGKLTFPCGNYARYEANVHAIALTLENLRAIDRYGVSHGQQFAGFAQIAAPATERAMTIEEAAGLIVGIARPQNDMAPELAKMVIHDRSIFNVYYREAAGLVHPDANAGDRERWDRLEIAKGVLEKHHEGQAQS